MGFIYQLGSAHSQKVYVGKSTTTPTERMRCHHKDYKLWLNGKQSYITSYELLKYTDCSMVVLEHGVPEHLLAEREAYWHSRYDCVNKQVPNRSHKESSKQWRMNNRDNIIRNNREYYQANKDEINSKQNQKYECQCGGRYTRANKARHHESMMHRESMARGTCYNSDETSMAD